MSQSSETTKTSRFSYLGYPDGQVENEYYTARVAPALGVTLCDLQGDVTIVQFFPWEEADPDGHAVYSKWITARASQIMASKGDLFVRWPFLTTESDDLLMIKCLIEEGINEVERQNAINPTRTIDPTAGEAVE